MYVYLLPNIIPNKVLYLLPKPCVVLCFALMSMLFLNHYKLQCCY